MKTIATLVLFIICFATPAAALDFNFSKANDEKLLTLATLAMIDYQQSVKMFYKSNGYKELNPLLGAHPERNDLLISGFTSLTLAYAVNELMPEGKFKNFLFDSIIATERLNIEENRQAIETGKRNFEGIMMVMSFEF
ncbi:MAG: hypothetical protein KKG47_10085 [Proteobacteria bacterium]|nr:hypothetical protein [Pseudomonadota bacterium]MBU1736623.1 hypothetical protein [Pseudomonadota bacterium]